MYWLYLVSAAVFGGMMVLQLLLGLVGLGDFGLDADTDADVDGDLGDGLNLLSARAIIAGGAFFGIAGMIALSLGLGPVLSVPPALAVGFVAASGTARVMRGMRRFESDGVVHIEGAIGLPGTVYLGIPGERAGMGKIHLTLQNRTVEYQAVTSNGEALPNGTPVVVVDVIGPDVVEVAPAPTLGGLLNG